MRLIITRHGKTIENAEGILQGHLPGTLSKLGREQARRLAGRLKNEKIDAIYSSDLARAADTAKEIGKFHPNIKIKLVKELRERNWGEFQGRTLEEAGFVKVRGRYRATKTLPKSVETWEKMYQRAKKFLDNILHQHKNDAVLFIGHNNINAIIILVIMGKKLDYLQKLEKLENTSISIYEIDEDKNHKVLLFNCTRHLA